MLALVDVAQLVGCCPTNGKIILTGHTPGLWLQSLVWMHLRGNQSMFLSLPFSFPSILYFVHDQNKECRLL